jgi:hypothetical protein
MRLAQTILEKHFTVRHKGKTYYISYLNSDRPCLGLVNRFTWEVLDQELEEIDVYYVSGVKKQQIDKNNELVEELINFCIKHFKDYRPDYRGYD